MKVRLDPDALDLEQLKETLNSPGYRMLTARLSATYAAELKKMASIGTWEATTRLQGFLAGLDCAARLPEILAKEIQARMAKRSTD